MTARRAKAWCSYCVLVIVFCTSAFLCRQGVGQGAGAASQAENGTIDVGPAKQIRADVDAWPLITHPKTSVDKRVNASLLQLNKELAETLRGCDADMAEFEKQAGTTGKTSGPASGDWSRKVEVTMRGPRFLSMIATDGFFCGGAHPDDDLTVVVFDLQTGALVDWTSFLAKDAGASSPKEVLGYRNGTPPLTLPALQMLYAADEESYCKDYFKESQPFFVWPDANSGTLIAQVAGLPHVAAPCKVDFKLTLDQAGKLGFAAELLRAIEESHRQAALMRRH